MNTQEADITIKAQSFYFTLYSQGFTQGEFPMGRMLNFHRELEPQIGRLGETAVLLIFNRFI